MADLSEGRELSADITLASDGAHHWVLARVPPSYGPDGGIVGHHSNRRRPSPGAIRTVAPLYEQPLAEERRHSTAEAAVTGLSQLAERLRSEATGFLAAMRR